MALNNSTALRQANSQNRVTQAGATAQWRVYNGVRPVGSGAVTGVNTLLATLIAGATIGTATNGALDIDEAGLTQTVGSHLNGTGTFIDLTTSAGVLVSRADIGAGAGNVQINGPVVTGQPVSFVAPATITEGNV